MLELDFVNPCYSLTFLTAWSWCPFRRFFFICLQLGSLIVSFSFLFVGALSFSFLGSFDARTVERVRSFPSGVPECALEKGKQDFSMGSDTQGDDDEVDDDIESEIPSRSEFFKLSVKDQLYISSVVALETAIVLIATYVTAEEIPHSCLERGVDWTSDEERRQIIFYCRRRSRTAQRTNHGKTRRITGRSRARPRSSRRVSPTTKT